MSPRKNTICIAFCSAALHFSGHLHAAEHFNLNALDIDSPTPSAAYNTAAINEGLEQVPGTYRVAVYVNRHFKFYREYRFLGGKDLKLHPVLHFKDLLEFGISEKSLRGAMPYQENDVVHDIKKRLPLLRTEADLNSLRLDLSIPQIYTASEESGNASVFADPGIIAAFSRYDISGAHKKSVSSDGGVEKNYYLRFHNGLNFHAWHLRSTLSLSSSERKARPQNSYIEHDLPQLRSRVVAGESDTPSEILDSVNIRGVQVSSQEEMMDDKEQGYSPVIRGVAPSDAKITLYRKGYMIFQTYVPGGPFELRSLPAEAGEGEIEVRMTEMNGKETVSRYNFSSLPVMQRLGTSKYALAVGRLTRSYLHDPGVIQYVYARGVSDTITLYGGVMHTSIFSSLLTGIGAGFGEIGAASLDVAAAMVRGIYATGGLRMRYYRTFDSTGTIFSAEHTLYPDKNYPTTGLGGLMAQLRDRNNAENYNPQLQSQLQLTVSQPAGEGSFYLSLSDLKYRSSGDNQTSLHAGYNFSLLGALFSLDFVRVKHYLKRYNDNQFSLQMQIPFSLFDGTATAGISFNSSDRHESRNTFLSGAGLEHDRLTYNLQQSKTMSQHDQSLSLNTAYYSPYSLTQAGFSRNANYRQLNYGLRGTVVLHPGGLTMSQPTGDTFSIVDTSGVSNVEEENSRGIKSDSNGFMIVPNLTPYRKNQLRLNVPRDNLTAEIDDPIQSILPAYGSVTAVKFRVKNGRKVFFTIHYLKGYVPFGSVVTDSDDESDTLAGQDGSVYLTGLKEHGQLTVKWGRTSSETCHADYTLPPPPVKNRKSRIIRQEIICV